MSTLNLLKPSNFYLPTLSLSLLLLSSLPFLPTSCLGSSLALIYIGFVEPQESKSLGLYGLSRKERLARSLMGGAPSSERRRNLRDPILSTLYKKKHS
jgi:hypothetical protein